MLRLLSFSIIVAATMQSGAYAQDWASHFGHEPARRPTARNDFANGWLLNDLLENEPCFLDRDPYRFALLDFETQRRPVGFRDYLVRGQDDGPAAGSGSGAGAAAATDPSALLTQFQIQDVFAAETYNASGHANTLILQPVLPFPVAMPGLGDFFPNHIIRPTLPIISPTADPDGPLGVEGGLGDLTVLDVGVHPVEGFGTLLFGYTAILPTATHPQLGRREWQFGPAAGLVYKEIPKTILGFIYQQPFSLQSDAQQILIQPIVVRQLPDNWYFRWGDLNWVFDTKTGDYKLPISVALGKVLTVGNQPINIFVEPFYTPEGLRSGVGGDKWGFKLNVTLLFPDKKFGPLLGGLFDEGCCECE